MTSPKSQKESNASLSKEASTPSKALLSDKSKPENKVEKNVDKGNKDPNTMKMSSRNSNKDAKNVEENKGKEEDANDVPNHSTEEEEKKSDKSNDGENNKDKKINNDREEKDDKKHTKKEKIAHNDPMKTTKSDKETKNDDKSDNNIHHSGSKQSKKESAQNENDDKTAENQKMKQITNHGSDGAKGKKNKHDNGNEPKKKLNKDSRIAEQDVEAVSKTPDKDTEMHSNSNKSGRGNNNTAARDAVDQSKANKQGEKNLGKTNTNNKADKNSTTSKGVNVAQVGSGKKEKHVARRHKLSTKKHGIIYRYESAIHPLSKWKEPYCHEHLTLYELYREPRKLGQDPNKTHIRCPLSKLNSEFKCSICLDYIKTTMIVKECLHRFCCKCIQKSIRVGKKECPTCRVHVPSRRSLRYDPKFDKLLIGILGEDVLLSDTETDPYGDVRRTTNKRSYVNHSNNGSTGGGSANGSSAGQKRESNSASDQNKDGERPKKIQRRHLQQAIHEKNEERKIQESNNNNGKDKSSSNSNQEESEAASDGGSGNDDNNIKSDSNSNVDFKKEQPTDSVMLELRRHPGEKSVRRLARECIRISEKAPVSVLKKFLSRKLPCSVDRLEIHSTHNDQIMLLQDRSSLKDVRENFSTRFSMDGSMILHYRTNDPQTVK